MLCRADREVEDLIAAITERLRSGRKDHVTRLQKIALVARSLERLPCDRCQEALTSGAEPDSDYRCGECSNSLQSRWQNEQELQRRILEGEEVHGRESA